MTLVCLFAGAIPAVYNVPAWRMLAFFLMFPLGLAITVCGPRGGRWESRGAGILIVALPLALILWRGDSKRHAWVAAPVLILPFLPFLSGLPDWIGGVFDFGAGMAFNGSIYPLIWHATGSRTFAAA